MNVLITGGSSGLGAAVARKVAEDGGRPLVLDRHPPKDDFEHMQADLADRPCAERAVHGLARAAGGLNAVVTAAGTDACGTLGDVPAEDWERVVQVNLLGTAAVVRAALPYLENEPSGRIVTVAVADGLASTTFLADSWHAHGVRSEIVFGGVTEVGSRPLGSLTFELVGEPAAVEAALADVRARTEVVDHGTAADPRGGGR